jgi:hypothetical protein
VSLGVRRGVDQPPGAEADQADRQHSNQGSAEWLLEKGAESRPASAGLAAFSDGREKREHPDEKVDDSARAVAQAGHCLHSGALRQLSDEGSSCFGLRGSVCLGELRS